MRKMNLKMNKGFTMVELLVALVILSIILAVSIFSIASVIAKSEERTCQANQQLIEDGYERDFLFAYNDVTFSMYVIEHNYDQCPSGEDYTYEEEKVTCLFIHEKIELKILPTKFHGYYWMCSPT